jgi:hypothetical protein
MHTHNKEKKTGIFRFSFGTAFFNVHCSLEFFFVQAKKFFCQGKTLTYANAQ